MCCEGVLECTATCWCEGVCKGVWGGVCGGASDVGVYVRVCEGGRECGGSEVKWGVKPSHTFPDTHTKPHTTSIQKRTHDLHTLTHPHTP